MREGIGSEGGLVLRSWLLLLLVSVAMVNASGIALSASSYQQISAEDIVEKTNSSPVFYDFVVINGDLWLNNTQFYPIHITNSIIRGNVSCEGVTFLGDVDFSDTVFQNNAIFNSTKFQEAANFNNSSFNGISSFNMSSFAHGGTFDFAKFAGTADFANAWFDKFGTFYNATFFQDALFYLSEFNGAYLNFGSAQFEKNLDFSGSRFNTYCFFEGANIGETGDFHTSKFTNGVDFVNATFQGYANFDRSHFIENSLFSGINFCSVADFQNTKFDGATFFNGTRFGKSALFDNAQFEAPSDFSGAKFESDLSMNSTSIRKMVLDGSTFGKSSRLFLAKADINRLMVEWSLIKDILSFDSSAYLSLIKNYKDLGQGNDANDCYFEYRQLSQMHKPFGLSKALDALAWLSCGYGVRPHYALFCGTVIIIIFSLIYWLGRGIEGFKDMHGHHLIISSTLFSILAFTANAKGLPFRGHYRYLGIAEGIIGWLLMALFLVTLGKLMIG
ncbi:Pentapeptide repeats (9 copies) [uncultured archaeon]|nr:Pentapeptide repeats (9 copies) [uncultured archaeon]